LLGFSSTEPSHSTHTAVRPVAPDDSLSGVGSLNRRRLAHFVGGHWERMGFEPQCAGGVRRFNPALLPPNGFIAVAMNLRDDGLDTMAR